MDFWIRVSPDNDVAPKAVQLSQVSSVQFEGQGTASKATLRVVGETNVNGETGINIFTVQGAAAHELREYIGQHLLGGDKTI